MAEETPSLSIPLTQKLKRIPGIFGIRLEEAPYYEVIKSEGEKEIRKYRSFILATITLNGDFELVRKEAFLILAHYIYGENKDHKNLTMTSPVFQDQHSPNSWSLSFILPHDYTLASAPTPRDKRIHLHKSPERLVAAIRYSGVNSLDKIKLQTQKLLEWLNQNHFYNPTQEVSSAEYDGPSTITFLRRNEIHIAVSSIQ